MTIDKKGKQVVGKITGLKADYIELKDLFDRGAMPGPHNCSGIGMKISKHGFKTVICKQKSRCVRYRKGGAESPVFNNNTCKYFEKRRKK